MNDKTCTKDNFKVVRIVLGNGHQCRDVDECKTGNNVCSVDSDCVNKFGSFECNCKEWPNYFIQLMIHCQKQ